MQKYRFDNVRVSLRSVEPSVVFTPTTVVTPLPDWDLSCIEPLSDGTAPDQVRLMHVLARLTPPGHHEAPLHGQVRGPSGPGQPVGGTLRSLSPQVYGGLFTTQPLMIGSSPFAGL